MRPDSVAPCSSRSRLYAALLLCVGLAALFGNASSVKADELTGQEEARAIYEQLGGGTRMQASDQPTYAMPDQPTVYLTFDDGPSNATPKVLDILKDNGIQATFFVLGKQAEEHPDLIKRILNEGHRIGNHSYDHVYKKLYSSFDDFWGQVRRTEGILNDIAGIRPRMVRAPGGTITNFDSFYYYYMDDAGYIMEDWNMDSGDSAGVGIPASKIVANVKKGRTYRQSVLLMHDGIGHGESAKAMPEIIKYFKNRGFAFGLLTPDVQPIQFRVGKVKWERSESFDAFFRHEEEAEQVRESWAAEEDEGTVEKEGHDDGDGSGLSAGISIDPTDNGDGATTGRQATVSEATYGVSGDKENGKAIVSANSDHAPEHTTDQPPLTVYAGTRPIRFGGGECELHNGQFYVSLRKLIEGEGGKVTWDNATRSAAIQYGLISAEYELAQHTIWQQSPGLTDRVERFADMRLHNGMLMVPLRRTAELLGDYVSDYAVSDQNREVTLNAGGGHRLDFYWNLRDNPPEERINHDLTSRKPQRDIVRNGFIKQ
jgi:peptidoglycan/xylan/chitin deacetylase (PgdA/CDA1 family)